MTNISLGSVAQVYNGKTPSKLEHRTCGHPVLKIKDISEVGQFKGQYSGFVDESVAARYRHKWIAAGDTLILNAAHNSDYVASKAYLATDQVAGSLPTGEWAIVRPDAAKLLPEYFHFWLRTDHTRKLLKFLVKGIHLYPKDLATLQVPVPPVEEQRRIIALLSRAENIVRMRREAEQKAKEIIPALFLDMFGDPERNPKGWKIQRLGDVVERLEGGKNVQAGSVGDSPFRILKISAVTSGIYAESESKPAPSGFDPPPHYIVREGDILFSRANTEALVGATAMVESTNGKSLLPDKLWRFVWRPTSSAVPAYMLAVLQDQSVRRELSKMASGTGGSMKNISQAKLLELKLPIAPASLQRAFLARAATLRGLLHRATLGGEVAGQVLQSLLARAFPEVRAT